MIGAYSGNVSNGASTLLQNTALNVVRSYGATEIKHLADGFSTETDEKGNPIPNATSETVRGLLHAVAGCAGASATGGDCASAGLASAGTVAMNNAMTALLNLNPNEMTDTQKQAYSNLMGTLVAGVSTAVGGDAAAASLASKVEVDNNATDSTNPIEIYKDLWRNRNVYHGLEFIDGLRSAFSVGGGVKAVFGVGAEGSATVNGKGEVVVQSGLTHGVGINLGPMASWQLVGDDPEGQYTRWTARGGVGVTVVHGSRTGWAISLDVSPGLELSTGTGVSEKYNK